MMKSIISDDAQLDTRERDHLGSGKHERLWFSMSPTGSATPESVAQVVERLVLKQQGRAPGSYAASVQHGFTVKVEVMWFKNCFKWQVRKGGEVTDEGIVVIGAGGIVEQVQHEQTPV